MAKTGILRSGLPVWAALICALSGCRGPVITPEISSESGFTLSGKVTITRNGVPLTLNECVYDESRRGYVMPVISAYTSPYARDATALGNTGYASSSTVTWAEGGSYTWSMEIPAEKIPGYVYFDVLTWMDNVYDSPKKTIQAVWVDGKSAAAVDLGTVNCETVTLSGNVPVTINGEAPEFAMMTIYSPDESVFCETEIKTGGDWSIGIIKPESEKRIRFRVDAYKNGGIFRKELNTSTGTIHRQSKTFVFPDSRSINFDAITLSGTLKALTPKGQQPQGYVEFYSDTADIKGWDAYNHVLGRSEITYLSADGDGSAVWTTMIPAGGSFPKKLQIAVDVQMGGDFYWACSGATIAGAASAGAVDLGVFTKWENYESTDIFD